MLLKKKTPGTSRRTAAFFIYVDFTVLSYFRSEGKERKLHEFERLDSEGNTYYRYAVKYSGNKIACSHADPEKDKPYEIYYRVSVKMYMDFFSERRKIQFCEFKALHSERYSDDRYAKHKTAQKPQKAVYESSEKKPYYIADKAHWISPFTNRW